MLPRISLRKVACFVTAADAGSISAAARKLGMSQASLSEALSDLEADLGTVLFHRHKARGITLTGTGVRMLVEARNLVRHADAFQSLAPEDGAELSGEIVVGCFPTMLPFMLPPLLAGFRKRHPRVTVRVVEGSQPALEEAMISGAIDVSILYDVDLVSAIERRRLTDCQPYLLLPPDHPLVADDPVDLYRVLDEPYIQMDVLPGRDDYIFSVLGIKPHVVVQRTTNFELVRALVARGFGYSILVQRPSIDLTYDGLPIATRTILNPVPPLRVIIGWPATMQLHRRAVAFVDFAVDAFAAPCA